MTTSRGPVLTVEQAAAYCAVSRSVMYRLSAECGTDLPVVHLTKQRRGFRQTDLDRWLDRRTIGRAS